jgi:hypothetical protein
VISFSELLEWMTSHRGVFISEYFSVERHPRVEIMM